MKSTPSTVTITDLMALAVSVDRYNNGLIRGTESFIDIDTGRTHMSNAELMMLYLESKKKGTMNPSAVDIMISKDDIDEAKIIIDAFNQIHVTKKLTNELNGFERQLYSILNKDNPQLNSFSVSAVASLPNSYRVQKMRDKNNDIFSRCRTLSEYIGEVGQVVRVKIKVVDVKYVKRYRGYTLFCLSGDNIVRLMTQNDPDTSALLIGGEFYATGNIRDHVIGKISEAKETILGGRVKFTPV